MLCSRFSFVFLAKLGCNGWHRQAWQTPRSAISCSAEKPGACLIEVIPASPSPKIARKRGSRAELVELAR